MKTVSSRYASYRPERGKTGQHCLKHIRFENIEPTLVTCWKLNVSRRWKAPDVVTDDASTPACIERISLATNAVLATPGIDREPARHHRRHHQHDNDDGDPDANREALRRDDVRCTISASNFLLPSTLAQLLVAKAFRFTQSLAFALPSHCFMGNRVDDWLFAMT